MIDIVNRQRSQKIRQKAWQHFAERALAQIDPSRQTATIVFVGDAAIRKLNREFRGRDQVTDVLSFPHEAEDFEDRSMLGEIVIAVPRAAAQAKANGLNFENEIQQL